MSAAQELVGAEQELVGGGRRPKHPHHFPRSNLSGAENAILDKLEADVKKRSPEKKHKVYKLAKVAYNVSEVLKNEAHKGASTEKPAKTARQLLKAERIVKEESTSGRTKRAAQNTVEKTEEVLKKMENKAEVSYPAQNKASQAHQAARTTSYDAAEEATSGEMHEGRRYYPRIGHQLEDRNSPRAEQKMRSARRHHMRAHHRSPGHAKYAKFNEMYYNHPKYKALWEMEHGLKRGAHKKLAYKHYLETM